MKLDIGTYNVCHLADFSMRTKEELPVNPEKIAKLIKDLDVVGLNEVYEKSDKEVLRNQIQVLSNLTGSKYYAFGLGKEFDWGDSIGNAVLSKYPIVDVEKVAVLEPINRRPNENDWYEDRIIVKATIDVGVKIDYISTHFGLNLLEQENMVEALVKIIDNAKNPVILCGDFNLRPREKVLTPIYERLKSVAEVMGKQDEYTLDSFNPYTTVDHIFVSKQIKVLSYNVIKKVVSDHFPIIAEVEI